VRRAPVARTPLPIGWKLGRRRWLPVPLGAALAAADVIVPLTVGLVLLAAILRGSNETYERVFRLLRWITNRPEPPAPGQDNPDAAMTGYGHHVGFRG
jgi:hypothetical protein